MPGFAGSNDRFWRQRDAVKVIHQLQVVWITTRPPDALSRREEMQEPLPLRYWPVLQHVGDALRLIFFAANEHPAIAQGIPGTGKLPAVRLRQNVDAFLEGFHR